jgi:uncharacterized membrane protein (DUF485 family)
MKIDQNLATWDRIIRLLIAFSMIGSAVYFADWIGDPVLEGFAIAFGVINLVASAIGFCPVYKMAGISTR